MYLSKCIKFIYSEKAPKFCKIFTLLLSYVVPVKSKVKISQNFVAFSEYKNFKFVSYVSLMSYCVVMLSQSKLDSAAPEEKKPLIELLTASCQNSKELLISDQQGKSNSRCTIIYEIIFCFNVFSFSALKLPFYFI